MGSCEWLEVAVGGVVTGVGAAGGVTTEGVPIFVAGVVTERVLVLGVLLGRWRFWRRSPRFESVNDGSADSRLITSIL